VNLVAEDNRIRIVIQVDNADVNRQVDAVNTKLGTLDQTVGRISRSLTAFAAIWAGRQLIGGITDAVKASIEFEDELIRLSKVMDVNMNQLDKMSDAAFSTAYSYGVSTKEVIRAQVEWARSGYNQNEILQMLNTTMDATIALEQDAETTIRYLVPTMKAFNMTVEESVVIVDSWNELSNKMGARADEIAAASKRAGLALAASGLDFHQATAMLATGIRLTGEQGEVIGRAFREIGVRADLLKINLWDLMMSWKNLSEHEKEQIEKLLQVGQHTVRFRTVMENADTVVQAFTMSINSQNSAQKEAQKNAESTSASLKRVSEAWGKFTRELINNDAIKQKSNDLAEFLKYLSENTDKLGEFVKAFDKIAAMSPLGNLASFWGEASVAVKDYRTELVKTADLSKEVQRSLLISDEKWGPGSGKVSKPNMGAVPASSNISWGEPKGVDVNAAAISAQQLLNDELVKKEQEKIDALRTQWAAWTSEKTMATLAGYQAETEMFNFQIETMKGAMTSLWTLAGTLKDTFASGISQMFSSMIRGTFDAKTAWKELGLTMLDAIIKWGVQKAVDTALTLSMMAITGGASKTLAASVALAWAPAAAMVSLATLGTNAAGAAAALVSTNLLSAGLAAMGAIGMQSGGIVPGMGRGDRVPALLEPGELVVPRKDVSKTFNNQRVNVNVSMAGAFIMDDPNTVDRLYREHLRDKIQNDILVGRDRFYG
jgi:hypothetical protein